MNLKEKFAVYREKSFKEEIKKFRDNVKEQMKKLGF